MQVETLERLEKVYDLLLSVRGRLQGIEEENRNLHNQVHAWKQEALELKNLLIQCSK